VIERKRIEGREDKVVVFLALIQKNTSDKHVQHKKYNVPLASPKMQSSKGAKKSGTFVNSATSSNLYLLKTIANP